MSRRVPDPDNDSIYDDHVSGSGGVNEEQQQELQRIVAENLQPVQIRQIEVEGRLQDVEDQQQIVDERLVEVDVRQQVIEERQQVVVDRQQIVEDRQQAVEERQQVVEGRLQEVEGRQRRPQQTRNILQKSIKKQKLKQKSKQQQKPKNQQEAGSSDVATAPSQGMEICTAEEKLTVEKNFEGKFLPKTIPGLTVCKAKNTEIKGSISVDFTCK